MLTGAFRLIECVDLNKNPTCWETGIGLVKEDPGFLVKSTHSEPEAAEKQRVTKGDFAPCC